MFKYILGRMAKEEPPDLRQAVLKELHEVTLKLDAARNHYNYVLQEDLIEAVIHEIQGLETRYKYLITAARDLSINTDKIEYCRRSC